MTESFKRPKLHPHRRHWLHLICAHWFFLVWLLIVVAVAYLYGHSSRFGGMTGVVEKYVIPIAPLQTAKLVSLNVVIGQRVKAGEILGTLEAAALKGDILVDETKMADMVSGYQQNILQLVRQYETTLGDAKTALETERLNQASDTAELAALKEDLKRRKELQGKQVINELDTTLMLPQIAALERAVAAYPTLIAAHEARLAQAAKAQDELRKWLNVKEDEEMLDVMHDVVEKGRTNLMLFRQASQLMMEDFLLRASADGMVCQIYYSPGATVLEGIPIIDLVAEDSANRIVGYLPEIYIKDIAVGQMATITRQSGQRIDARAFAEFVSPVVDALPTRLSPIAQASAGVEVRTRRVHFRLEGQHDLIPGETVQVRMVSPLRTSLERFFRSISNRERKKL